MEQQNTEKLTDQAFSRMLLTSVLCIALCLVCLCSTTYAWFSDSVSGGMNQIQAGNACQLTISVDGTELQDVDNGDEMPLEADKTYTVVLLLPKNSGSGYCVITAGGIAYYTDTIARHESETPQTLTFTLSIAKNQTVTFTRRWGIYSGESNVKDGQLHIL